MHTDPVIVIGGGGHGKVVASVVKKCSQYTLLGYCDTENHGPLLGAPYLGDDASLPSIKEKHPTCVAALGIGYLGKGDQRQRIVEKVTASGVFFPAIVSPDAVVNEDVTIGVGTVIMDAVVVNVGTRLGMYVILNTQASVDHDCHIGDFVHIAPGVTLSGGIRVGARSLIGTGATVIHSATIGKDCIIGAGAAVVRDCIESGVYLGVPAVQNNSTG